MKTPEDEAWEEMERRQGAGGFPAKRQMAADKLHWSDCAVHNEPAYPAGKCDCGVAQEPDLDIMRQALRVIKQLVVDESDDAPALQGARMRKLAIEKALRERLAQPTQEPQIAINAQVVGYVEPQRSWVGLTDDELADLWYKESLDWMEFARAHEAALKEKNNG
jgi:hypothetical protein